MFEEKVVVGVASTCSTLAIVACLIVVPSLYQTINEIHNEVSRETGQKPLFPMMSPFNEITLLGKFSTVELDKTFTNETTASIVARRNLDLAVRRTPKKQAECRLPS
jgi:hypothetical protein